MSCVGIFLLTHILASVHARTFKQWFAFNIFNENTAGDLIEVQERTFKFGANGTISIHMSCNYPPQPFWGDAVAFNIFLCDESPKTKWLYLYPSWGMCYDRYHTYHHCSIDKLTETGHNTWTYNKTISESSYIVARIRNCPIYHTITDLNLTDTFINSRYLVQRYSCEYTGIFLNKDTRLSQDEVWNPFIYGFLTVVYGAMVLKSIVEIVIHRKYRVYCSFYVYTLLYFKFFYIMCTFLYYNRILTAGDLSNGYTDYMFVMAMTLACKFTAYYLTLLAISGGYCIYNPKPILNTKCQAVFAMIIYTLYFYLFVLNDSYVEVPLVVIVSAAYAAMLALFWAYHFKRLLLIRYEFHSLRDRQEHTIARNQIYRKEILVGIAFAEIICFLAFIILFEFYRADNYPVPGTTGVVATECVEFVIIAPLTMWYNMRDLSRFYPAQAPPPIIHVIKTPDEGYKISVTEGENKELSINEQTSEIHLITLPSYSSSSIENEDDFMF